MYKGKFFIRESVYVCGEFLDADIYPVFQPAGKRRKRCRPTAEIQARINQRNAEKKIARLAHMNFTEEDVALHLTYADEPESADAAARDLYNFIRRVRRLRQKAQLPDLKYISSTEAGARGGRVHHHLILSGGVCRDTLEKLWGKGFANSKRLQFTDSGILGLTHYIVKDRQFYRRWNRSKNLIVPEARVRDGAITVSEMAEITEAVEELNGHRVFEARYEGFNLVEVDFIKNQVNRGSYIRVEMRRRC